MLKRTPFLVFALFVSFIIKSTTMHAFDVEQVKHEITIQLSEDLKGNPKNKPVLILIGGYPGAGKTTLINALAQENDIDVIQRNAIRQALLDRKLIGSPYDGEIIDAVTQNLFKICLQCNANIIIDGNAHSHSLKLFQKLLESENYQDKYQVIKICLNPPTELLLSRLRARKQQEDVHAGTEEALRNNLNDMHKKLNMDDYSLIIKNDEQISFEAELKIVNAFLNPYFDQQR